VRRRLSYRGPALLPVICPLSACPGCLTCQPTPTGKGSLRTLVRLAKIRWRIEHDYRELKDGLGLDHFEGRSYLGWHRHVTLTALAQAFCTHLRHDPKAPAPA
jgi:SRSO17 transposase